MVTKGHDRDATPAATTTATRRLGAWVLGLAAGLVAAALTWGAGEAAVNRFTPESVGNAALGPMQGGGITAETLARATAKDATLAYGLQGGLLGLVLGLAGAVAGGSARAGARAALAGLVVGGLVGAGAAFGLFTLLGTLDPIANDLILPMLAHASAWSLLGAAGTLAFGLGLGGGRVRVGRAALGGFLGGALGAVVYEVLGAALLPLAQTSRPVAISGTARLIAHTAVDLLAALGAALATEPARGPSAPSPGASA